MTTQDELEAAFKRAFPYKKPTIGYMLRRIRIVHGDILGDMAKLLGVSVVTLSAVENGKQAPDPAWVDILAEHYGIHGYALNDLRKAVENGKNERSND